MSQVSDPAGYFLRGASLGLQYRAQNQQANQFAQSSALAQDRFALDKQEAARRVAEHEDAVAKDRITGRLWADKLRASLMPRGGMAGMTPHGPVFTPPGEDDDIHAMLDQVDGTDQASLFADVVKTRETRNRFRSEISAMERGGYADLLNENSDTGRLFKMIKDSRDPETGLKELWQLRDAIYQDDRNRRQVQQMLTDAATNPGSVSTISTGVANILGSKATAQEIIKNQNESRGNVIKAFETGMKDYEALDKSSKGKDKIAQREMEASREAYQAALNGLVTQDGWAILNDGKPNKQGFIVFRHPTGKEYQIAPDQLVNGIPQSDSSRGRAPTIRTSSGTSRGSAQGSMRKVTQADINDIVAKVGTDKAAVMAEMKRRGLTE